MSGAAVYDKAEEKYLETDWMLSFRTPDGLRARVHYRYSEFDDGYHIYLAGDPTYALVAFYLYKFYDKRRRPKIAEIGRPSDLTYE